jgi:hypothetical protein
MQSQWYLSIEQILHLLDVLLLIQLIQKVVCPHPRPEMATYLLLRDLLKFLVDMKDID